MATYPSRLLSPVTPPTGEPLTLAETKLFLRVDGTEDDSLITDIIGVAREVAEQYLRSSLMTQSWKLVFDETIPDKVMLPMGPVVAITEVKMLSRSGEETIFDSSLYYMSASMEELVFDQLPVSHKVEISYSAGYGDASDIPRPIRQGMLLHASSLYRQRDLSGIIPVEAVNIYAPYKRVAL